MSNFMTQLDAATDVAKFLTQKGAKIYDLYIARYPVINISPPHRVLAAQLNGESVGKTDTLTMFEARMNGAVIAWSEKR